MCQALLPHKSGSGRCLAMEILVPNPAIRNLIREDKVHQIYSSMQTGQAKYGMQTMNQSLFNLFSRRLISREDCIGRSPDLEEMMQMMSKGGTAAPAPQYRKPR